MSRERQPYDREHDPSKRGFLWEEEVFGISSERVKRPDRLSWQDAIADVIKKQDRLGWDPLRPKTKAAKRIFDGVLGYLPAHLACQLQMYCSIGTSLDFNYGIDGFFLIRRYIVSIDLVARRSSSSGAQVVISKLEADVDISRICEQIASRFRKRFSS